MSTTTSSRLTTEPASTAEGRPVSLPLWAELAVYLVATGVGLVLGFDFGHQVTGGALLGLVTALMGALFCSILSSAVIGLVERVLQQRARRGQPRA